MSDFLFGLDLGQSGDFTAGAVHEVILDETDQNEREYQFQVERALQGGPRPDRSPVVRRLYHLRHLQRWALGTSYVTIVQDVADMLGRLGRRCTLLVDRTGVGAGIFDLFRAMEVKVKGITITSGQRPHPQPYGWSVPKADLVGAVQATLSTGRLWFAGELPHRELLRQELQNFEARVTTRGHLQLAADWRTGEHDDLALAVALGLWYGERRPSYDPRDWADARVAGSEGSGTAVP